MLSLSANNDSVSQFCLWAVPCPSAEVCCSSWGEQGGLGATRCGDPSGAGSPAAPDAASPALLSPFRWLPSVPRRAEEPSEDFALRVQEVGGWGGRGLCGLLRFGMVPESRVQELPRALLDGCICMMGTLAPIYCPLFFPWPVCDPTFILLPVTKALPIQFKPFTPCS